MLCSAVGLLAAVLGAPTTGMVRPEEAELAREWAQATFAGAVTREPVAFGLEVRANHGVVQRNMRGGRPLRLGATEFGSGLYCHAPSEVVVHLPSPGRVLRATVGVDSNTQTSGGRGSVRFSVRGGGQDLATTDVRREGMPPLTLDVQLAGAREFTLAIDDGGDGISCDQADWVDATVELESGEQLRLGDLPLFDRRGAPPAGVPPFSFRYGARESAEFLASWPLERSVRDVDASRTEHTLTWRDPETGLVVRLVGVEYHDFPTVEWTVWFRNDGTADTPIISDIQGLDLALSRDEGAEFVLHHNTGSPCTPTDYQPFDTPLPPSAALRITAAGGRPTNSDLPLFRVEQPGGGMILGLAWPGQWAASFTRDAGNGLRVRGGQELTHLTLHPGEEIRGPLAVAQFFVDEPRRAQNVWRRWMLAHNTPHPDGRAPGPTLAAVSGNHFPMLICDHDGEMQFLHRLERERIPIDYWWMDAGWYPNVGGWPNTGTWEVDTKRFPGGLRAISDYVHQRGTKLLVWFEPERVTPGTWLYENHPEWLLGNDGETKLLNLGNPDARQWLTDHTDGLLTEQGIDLYRQDFNIDPLPFWRAHDTEDRQGITEIRHVMGYLAYWDELLRRHPGMLIDSCASGGRRNDLETLRRAVPLLRSDWICDPVANQCHIYGIAEWMPFHGTGFIGFDPYTLRSCYTPWFTVGPDLRRDDLDYPVLHRLIDEWRTVAPYLLGDYYPLTGYSSARDTWMAWQFDRPDLGGGMVQVFRREESPFEVARFRLRGLAPDTTVDVTNLDEGSTVRYPGRELLDTGLRVEIKERPGAAVLRYATVGTQ